MERAIGVEVSPIAVSRHETLVSQKRHQRRQVGHLDIHLAEFHEGIVLNQLEMETLGRSG
jgi:hypothetical protein